ncbi:MAG: 4-carboxy-4-hydroxy-2-oxoadipate aldolase/oxaloacetate decarboxylase [SAR202 cluster bacterium]|nr:4-carboxy-4-hydroxy-2-oxoadipate aldolase/oxaloacetate decarboxylase [SAR202 cluster bacterium]|tara:strand:+ start:10798 stop:11430 length:633 start_codon:yes stop_codon:yes gene_type:complete
MSDSITRPDQSLVDGMNGIGTATIHEAGGQIGALPSYIKPVSDNWYVCGVATTILSPPKDNLWLHRGIYQTQPGDVMIVDTGGFHEAGYWGEIMTHAAQQVGVAGLVIDGCVRDGAILEELGMPVFSAGLCIRGTTKNKDAYGGINVPIRIGEIWVFPGDLVVGDRDGVVVVPQSRIAEITEKSKAREDKESVTISKLKAGERTIDMYGF